MFLILQIAYKLLLRVPGGFVAWYFILETLAVIFEQAISAAAQKLWW